MKWLRICFMTSIHFFLLLAMTRAEGPGWWHKEFGGNQNDAARSVQQLTDGGFIIAGWTESFGAGGMDYYAVRTDENGDTIWTRPYGGIQDDFGVMIRQTSDGCFVFVGKTQSFGAGETDIYLIKMNASGDTIWTRTYGGLNDDFVSSVIETSDGGYAISGTTPSFDNNDVYLIKTDSDGNTIWEKTYGGRDYEFGGEVQQTFDGGYIIVGGTTSFGAGFYDVYLVKTDESGHSLWTKAYGGSGYDGGFSVQQTSDSGYIVAGATSSYGCNAYLIRTDPDGDTIWTKTFGGTYAAAANSVCQTFDGGFALAGGTGTQSAYDNVYVVQTDAVGNLLWSREFGGQDYEYGNGIQQISDGGFIIAGETRSFGSGGMDVFLIKKAAIAGMKENPKLFDALNLSEIKPNPFKEKIEISIRYHGNKSINIQISNSIGQKIRSIKSKKREIIWDSKDDNGVEVPAGTYFVRIGDGVSCATKKIIKIR
jgi:hypothetical protein